MSFTMTNERQHFYESRWARCWAQFKIHLNWMSFSLALIAKFSFDPFEESLICLQTIHSSGGFSKYLRSRERFIVLVVDEEQNVKDPALVLKCSKCSVLFWWRFLLPAWSSIPWISKPRKKIAPQSSFSQRTRCLGMKQRRSAVVFRAYRRCKIRQHYVFWEKSVPWKRFNVGSSYGWSGACPAIRALWT